jgi:hypothetical protein
MGRRRSISDSVNAGKSRIVPYHAASTSGRAMPAARERIWNRKPKRHRGSVIYHVQP